MEGGLGGGQTEEVKVAGEKRVYEEDEEENKDSRGRKAITKPGR